MESKNLQVRFSKLKNELDDLKAKKTRTETQLETLEKDKAEAFEELKTLTKADSIEKIEKVHVKLKEKIQTLLAEAEALFEEATEVNE